jgi:hypothetical protein
MDQAINTPLITEQVRDKPGSLRLTSGNLLDTHRYRPSVRAVSGGWPSASATNVAQRVSTGARLTWIGWSLIAAMMKRFSTDVEFIAENAAGWTAREIQDGPRSVTNELYTIP